VKYFIELRKSIKESGAYPVPTTILCFYCGNEVAIIVIVCKVLSNKSIQRYMVLA
jgi:hypothetical protein